MSTYDIRGASLDAFLEFLFDHQSPVSDGPMIDAALEDARQSGEPLDIQIEVSITSTEFRDRPVESEEWWFNAEVRFEPGHLARLYMDFFRRPVLAFGRFTPEELDHGFWAAHSGAGHPWAISELIWNTDLSFDDRAELVRSMKDLFRGAAEWDAAGSGEATWWNSLHMWWDSIAYDWHCGNRSRESGLEDARMQDVIFETLTGILSIEHPAARGSALHGLGHLHHPDTRSLIEGWIDSHRDEIDDESRAYASAASRFDVL